MKLSENHFEVLGWMLCCTT